MSRTKLIVKDNVPILRRHLGEISKNDVLVGVPAAENERDDQFGNADIMFIAEHGSPANNVPPRPVLSIGVERAREKIEGEMERAAKMALDGKPIDTSLDRVGIIASTSAKRVIDQQDGIEPPAESTLRSREGRGFDGVKSLLVSGQFRNSITYVKRKK